MNKLIIGLAVAITVFFALVTTEVMSEEITPEKKPIEQKVKGWVIDEWNEIKTFQANNWQQGKDQLAKNKEQIINLFSKIANN